MEANIKTNYEQTYHTYTNIYDKTYIHIYTYAHINTSTSGL